MCICVIAFCPLAHAQSLQEQDICAKQAQKAFEYWRGDDKKMPRQQMPILPDTQTITLKEEYQSHYNTRIKKCLVLIEYNTQNEGETHVNKVLLDAFERRYYGYYLWTSRPGKKVWEVPPISCELAPSFQEQTNCTSTEAFDAFVAKYMEE